MDLGSHDQFAAARADETAAFRPIGWQELCARIGIRQSQRATADAAPAFHEASFSAASARRLAAMRNDRNGAESVVNPILSAAGKADEGTSSGVVPATGSAPAAGSGDTIAQVRNEP